jgi:F0F1-type ATP synthase delta subunit
MLTADSLAKTILTLSSSEGGRDVVSDTVTYLKKKGALALLPRVASSLARMIEKETTGSEVRIANAAAKKEALAAAESLGIDAASAKVVVDDTLIGGYTVAKKGMQIDTSHKSALLSIYRSVTRGS